MNKLVSFGKTIVEEKNVLSLLWRLLFENVAN